LTARLRARVLRGQRAFVVAIDQPARTVIAHTGCDDLSLDALIDLATRACALSQLSSVIAGRGTVAVFGDLAFAAWQEGGFLHVIIDADDMAFSRLVSQLVSVNP
jgi:hypothetical protein